MKLDCNLLCKKSRKDRDFFVFNIVLVALRKWV